MTDVPLVEETPSSASTLDLALSGDYVFHRIWGYLVPDTNADFLEMTVTTDNFSTVKTGASDYAWHGYDQTSTFEDTADNSIVLTRLNVDQNTNPTGVVLCMDVIRAAASGAVTGFFWRCDYFSDAAGAYVHTRAGAVYTATGTVNGVRFNYQTGNIASGYMRVSGLPTS